MECIDIQLIIPKHFNQIDIFANSSKHFLIDADVTSIQTINFTPGKKSDMPVGLYMGINYRILPSNEKWKMEIRYLVIDTRIFI